MQWFLSLTRRFSGKKVFQGVSPIIKIVSLIIKVISPIIKGVSPIMKRWSPITIFNTLYPYSLNDWRHSIDDCGNILDYWRHYLYDWRQPFNGWPHLMECNHQFWKHWLNLKIFVWTRLTADWCKRFMWF